LQIIRFLRPNRPYVAAGPTVCPNCQRRNPEPGQRAQKYKRTDPEIGFDRLCFFDPAGGIPRRNPFLDKHLRAFRLAAIGFVLHKTPWQHAGISN